MKHSITTLIIYLLLLLPAASVQAGEIHILEQDTLIFKSFSIEGNFYLVKIVFVNEKTIDVLAELKDSSGVILQSRSMKAKRYPVKENETAPVLFEPEIFTAGYHCPVMIYLERLGRMQLYIDDAGCYAGEEIVPSMFGTLMRSN